MFDKMDFSKMSEMLQDAQKKVQELQEEVAKKEFRVKAGAGMIEVVINGKNEIIDLSIDDSLLEDKESLQILLISAVNDAIKMLEDDKKNAASTMFGGLGNFGAI